AARAAKLLVEYAGEDGVQTALEEDIRTSASPTVPRVVATYFDSIDDEQVRQTLAPLLLERGERERSFLPYARMLKASRHKAIATLARERLS
ncbi:MAG: hypothetical protein KDD44_06755, partial [Bdellovibrionales bacterium]|nr:hypothetical protein [Bdellovibrionales bacterium]